MKLFHHLVVFVAFSVAYPCASYAQGVKPDTTPMTAEQMQKALLARSGRHKPSYTPEQIAAYNQQEEQYRNSLTAARELYRKEKYANSAKVYEGITWSNRFSDRWEAAEAYRAAGKLDQAIKWYRFALYQKVKTSRSRTFDPSPRVKLSDGDISQEIEVWADSDPVKIGQFALLLAQNGEYEEAVAVYNQALQYSSASMRPEWQTAISLGNLSPTNFDRRRFAATVNAMMAANGASISWMQLHYKKPNGNDYDKERYAWIDEAAHIKPDYAPALYIKADMITTTGGAKSTAEYAEARKSLAQAEQYARSDELRTMIRKLRNDHFNRLQ